MGKRRSVVEAVWDEFRPELERSIQEDEVWQPLRAAQDSLRSGAASQSQMHQWTIERATRRILQERLSSKALHKPPEWYNQGSNMSEAIKLTVTLSKLVQSWPEGLAGLVKLTQPTCLFSYKSEEREGAQLARELQNKLSTAVSTREIDKQARFDHSMEPRPTLVHAQPSIPHLFLTNSGGMQSTGRSLLGFKTLSSFSRRNHLRCSP